MSRPNSSDPCEVVAITGVGLVTPLGDSGPATWRALLDGRYVCGHARAAVDTPAGVSRIVELAVRAAREAVAEAYPVKAGGRTALVVGTSKGPIEQWMTSPLCSAKLTSGEQWGDDDWGLAALAGDVRRRLVLTLPRLAAGPSITLSAACASGLHALIRAALMLRAGEADRALVVAVESSLHPLFSGSFRRLGVLADESVGCRPFDRERGGFTMSEAAAAVFLQRIQTPPTDVAASAGPTPGRPAVRLERSALAGDATHLTGGDPDARTLRRVLRDVIAGRPVDVVHAHATGTRSNDAIELAAIDAEVPPVAAGAHAPLVYSHKGALGHSLGASGLVSCALNVWMHRTSIVPGNVRCPRPLDASGVAIEGVPVERRVRRSIVFAAGFGGAMAGVCLSSE